MAELAGEHPALRAHAPRDRARPARASASPPMPAREDHDPRLRAARRRAAGRARHRAARSSSATRWAASSPPSSRSSSPTRVEQLVLVSRRPGSRSSTSATSRVARRAARAAGRPSLIVGGGCAATRSTRSPGARGRGDAHAARRAIPDRLPAPLIAEQVRGSGKPGFIDALDALTDYPIRDRLGEIACPTLIVWGTNDRLVPVARRRRVRAADPGLAQGRLRRHRAHGDARAPGAFNARRRGVPRRGASAARRAVVAGERRRRGRRRRRASRPDSDGWSTPLRRRATPTPPLAGPRAPAVTAPSEALDDERGVLRQHAGRVGVRRRS